MLERLTDHVWTAPRARMIGNRAAAREQIGRIIACIVLGHGDVITSGGSEARGLPLALIRAAATSGREENALRHRHGGRG